MSMHYIRKHVFDFNKKNNSGETLLLETDFIDNGDNNESSIYTNHILTLNSYSNSASINLTDISITPSILRELANELESAYIEAKNTRDNRNAKKV